MGSTALPWITCAFFSAIEVKMLQTWGEKHFAIGGDDNCLLSVSYGTLITLYLIFIYIFISQDLSDT